MRSENDKIRKKKEWEKIKKREEKNGEKAIGRVTDEIYKTMIKTHDM